MAPAFRVLPVVVVGLLVMLAVRGMELWTGFTAVASAHADAMSGASAPADLTAPSAPPATLSAGSPDSHMSDGEVPAAAPTQGSAPTAVTLAAAAPTGSTGATAPAAHLMEETPESKDENIPGIAQPEGAPPPPVLEDGAPAAPHQTAAPRQKIPGEQDFMSASEIEVLSSLTKRREDLDKRSAELDMREKLLIATEQRLDQKLAEIKGIEAQIQSAVHTLDANQAKQVASLVKVYETMKPKDAASIMQDLDKSILIEVAARMKEAKMAPILAAMDAQKARELTVLLMKRNELPGRDG